MLCAAAQGYAQPTYSVAAQLRSPERVVLTALVPDGEDGFYAAGSYRAALTWGDTQLPAPVGIGAFAARLGADLQPHWLLADPGPNTDAFDVVRPAPDGSTWWAGSFFGSAQLGDSLLQTPNNEKGAFLLRTGPDGQVLAAHLLTGPGTKTIADLAVAADGAVYLTGSYSDTLRLGALALTSDPADRLAYVARLSPDGNWTYALPIGTAGTVDARALTLAADGRVVVAGDFDGQIDWNGATAATIGVNVDVFALALDATTGGAQWLRRAGGEQPDRVSAAASDAAGNVYITGQFTAVLSAAADLTVQTPNFEPDVYLLSYTADGTPRYLRRYGGTGPETVGDLQRLGERLWLTGIFRTSTDLDGQLLEALPGSESAGYVLQTDLDGHARRALPVLGSEWVVQRRLAVAADERVTLAGRFTGTLEAAPQTLTTTGDYDGYLLTLDLALTPTQVPPQLSEVRLFPNPASTVIHWQSDRPLREVRLYDATGVLRYEAHDTDRLQVGDLARGNYRLQLIGTDGSTRFATLVLH